VSGVAVPPPGIVVVGPEPPPVAIEVVSAHVGSTNRSLINVTSPVRARARP
jgi:hypothetical protein